MLPQRSSSRVSASQVSIRDLQPNCSCPEATKSGRHSASLSTQTASKHNCRPTLSSASYWQMTVRKNLSTSRSRRLVSASAIKKEMPQDAGPLRSPKAADYLEPIHPKKPNGVSRKISVLPTWIMRWVSAFPSACNQPCRLNLPFGQCRLLKTTTSLTRANSRGFFLRMYIS